MTKTDLADAVKFRREEAMKNLKRISHHAQIIELPHKRNLPAAMNRLLAREESILPPVKIDISFHSHPTG